MLKKSFLPKKNVTYTIVQTEKGYRVLKDKVIFLDGMQLKFMYDLKQNLVPDLDMIFSYFESPDQFQELVALELVTVRPQRVPGPGEKKLIESKGYFYVGIRASVFRADLTEEGKGLLAALIGTTLFTQCMGSMDEQMAENLLRRSI